MIDLSFGVCDEFFRVVKEVGLVRIEGVTTGTPSSTMRPVGRRLHTTGTPSSTMSPIGRRLQAMARQSVAAAANATNDRGMGNGTALFLEVTGGCRNCPVSDSGTFALFDDAFGQGRGLKESKRRSLQVPLDICFCPQGKEPGEEPAPSTQAFAEYFFESLSQSTNEPILLNISLSLSIVEMPELVRTINQTIAGVSTPEPSPSSIQQTPPPSSRPPTSPPPPPVPMSLPAPRPIQRTTPSPTLGPTSSPTNQPTKFPTPSPTTIPPTTANPTTGSPSTTVPTKHPMGSPTLGPTLVPTKRPMGSPTLGPTLIPTPGPTFSSFSSTPELRLAVFDAKNAGSNCFANVYQTYGPMNAWDVSRLDNLDYVFQQVPNFPFCDGGQVNLNSWDVSQVTSMRSRLQTSTD
jgi:hypothetical protein